MHPFLIVDFGKQRMQKELKTEFWTQISEISFQVMRRK